jgi:hypothetical protein
MSLQSIFNKGNFQPIQSNFQKEGRKSLQNLSSFQKKFKIYDTDTTINAIRDTIIASYLGYDLVNIDKHGFDAKKSKTDEFLEIKQCSYSSESWGGTWNDTNEEKALAFSDPRVFTAVAIWSGWYGLEFLVFGKFNAKFNAKLKSFINISDLIKKHQFTVIVPFDKTVQNTIQTLCCYDRSLAKYVNISTFLY